MVLPPGLEVRNIFERHPTDDAFMKALRSGHPFYALKHLPEGTLTQIATHMALTVLVGVVCVVLLVVCLRCLCDVFAAQATSRNSCLVGHAQGGRLDASCDSTPTCVSGGLVMPSQASSTVQQRRGRPG
mmetsp:Transcript_96906/g.278884  ORF Transcript_96906/g.278884 Transcript_96906/m.278884 type:complete len:129 (-) Transcript_96906:159-545(-)